MSPQSSPFQSEGRNRKPNHLPLQLPKRTPCQTEPFKMVKTWSIGSFLTLNLLRLTLFVKIRKLSHSTTFPEYLLIHNIRQSKLFVAQTLLKVAELQNYLGSIGSQYIKQISGAQRWILNNKIVSAWVCLDSLGGTSLDVRRLEHDTLPSSLPLLAADTCSRLTHPLKVVKKFYIFFEDFSEQFPEQLNIKGNWCQFHACISTAFKVSVLPNTILL